MNQNCAHKQPVAATRLVVVLEAEGEEGVGGEGGEALGVGEDGLQQVLGGALHLLAQPAHLQPCYRGTKNKTKI